jgi:hypothetical protein
LRWFPFEVICREEIYDKLSIVNWSSEEDLWLGLRSINQDEPTKNVSYIDFWPGMTSCLCG